MSAGFVFEALLFKYMVPGLALFEPLCYSGCSAEDFKMTRLNWGMIGGGEGSQIGPAHRISAALDGLYTMTAGALDVDAAKGRDFATRLGIAADRSYGDWREMLQGERNRRDRVDLVTVATPNSTHYGITKAFLEAGINVLCEKPMTVTVAEAEDLVATAKKAGAVCAVNYGYSGYALVRHMRAMVARGDLGKVRLIKAEFAHGFHADAADADNPRVRWRYDPAQAGISAQFADCGIHALHMASYVSGQDARELTADFVSCLPGRTLEDDAMVSVRMDGGALVRLWTSSVAIGRMHGLNIQVFGEKGGLRWAQEWPNQLYWTPLNGRTEILERGSGGLSPEAARASRVTVGHAEGMPLAFANIYSDLAEVIRAKREGRKTDPLACHYPTAVDGLRSIAAIEAAVSSARHAGQWTDARPPSLR
jgi:predicted dehydrogenase